MSAYELTKTRFVEGVWEGILSLATSATPGAPEVEVTLLERHLDGVTVTPVDEEGRWLLQIPVPAELIGDGVQVFLIHDARDETLLGSFTLISGEVLGDDIRAEMELLRAELDMLKRAFRRHCLETT